MGVVRGVATTSKLILYLRQPYTPENEHDIFKMVDFPTHVSFQGCKLRSCVSATKGKSSHTPYRNSKLTMMLKDSLGGDSKTLMPL